MEDSGEETEEYKTFLQQVFPSSSYQCCTASLGAY